MIVVEYEAKFKELANFIPTLDVDDTKKTRYFERGVRDNTRKMMKAQYFQ